MVKQRKRESDVRYKTAVQNIGKIRKNTNLGGGGGKEHILLDGSHASTARPYDKSGTKINTLKCSSQQHDTRTAEF